MIDYQTKCNILGDLWQNYRSEKTFKEFIEYNDLGLPLAFLLREGLVEEITETGQLYVNETFNLFIAALGVDESEMTDGMSLDQLLEFAEKKQD